MLPLYGGIEGKQYADELHSHGDIRISHQLIGGMAILPTRANVIPALRRPAHFHHSNRTATSVFPFQ
jgi:hypothetical protein